MAKILRADEVTVKGSRESRLAPRLCQNKLDAGGVGPQLPMPGVSATDERSVPKMRFSRMNYLDGLRDRFKKD